MTDDESHLLGRAERSRDEQVALVLAVVVIGDDHDFARGERRKDRLNALITVEHLSLLPQARANGHVGGSPICPR